MDDWLGWVTDGVALVALVACLVMLGALFLA